MSLATELAQAQADAVAALCDQTCTITRNTGGTVARGHKSAGFTNVATLVPCNVTRPASGLFRDIAAKLATVNVWDMSLPIGQDVREGDRIVLGSDTLTVHSVGSPESFPILLHVLVAEVV